MLFCAHTDAIFTKTVGKKSTAAHPTKNTKKKAASFEAALSPSNSIYPKYYINTTIYPEPLLNQEFPSLAFHHDTI